MSDKAQNPYVGPVPFTINESARFYGREGDLRRLMTLFVARRIVLLYSPSGAGKTSLVQAKMLPALARKGFEVLPVIRVSRWQAGGTREINNFVYSTINSLMAEQAQPGDPNHAGEASARARPDADDDNVAYADLIHFWQGRREVLENKRGVLFFDQFEEVLTADPHDHGQKDQFFDQLGAILEKDDRLWALFAIREDYLAELDPFRHLIPGALSSTYRLELLNAGQALDAIQKPAADAGVTISDEAAEKLIGQLRRVTVRRRDGQITFEEGPFVEPVQLQVVCQTLWQDLKPEVGNTIEPRWSAAEDHVDKALGDFYDKKVAEIATEWAVERDIRQWFDHHLITEQGLRGQVMGITEQGSREQVMGSEKLDLTEEVIGDLVNAHLIRAEVRRGIPWYELAHDRLVRPIRVRNETWFKQNLSLLQRRAEAYKRAPDNELLLHGKQLQEAETWAIGQRLKKYEDRFLNASRARERARTRKRWAFRAVLIVIMGLLISMFVLWRTAVNANRDLEGARQNLEDANRDLEGARQSLEDTNRDLQDALIKVSSLATDAKRAEADAIEARKQSESLRLADRAEAYLESGNVTGALLAGRAAILIATTAAAETVLREAFRAIADDLPPNDSSVWPDLACELAGRNMTLSEWQEAFASEPYERLCFQYGTHISNVEEALLACERIAEARRRYAEAEQPIVDGLPLDFDEWAVPLLLDNAAVEPNVSRAQACLRTAQDTGFIFDRLAFMQFKERLTRLSLDFSTDVRAQRVLQEVEALDEQRNEWPAIVAAPFDEPLSGYYREFCVNLPSLEDANRACKALNLILQHSAALAHFVPITRTETTDIRQTYAFQGNYGDIVTIVMEVRGESDKPNVTLRDASDSVIRSQDTEAATLSDVILPASGNYFLDLAWGRTTPLHSLSLVRTEPAPVSLGSTVDAAADARIWRFEGNADDVVTIVMEARGKGDPLLRIRDEEGEVIGENDDFGGSLNSRIQVKLPAEGEYFIDAGWFRSSIPVPYRLALSRVENLALGDAVEAAAGQLEWMFAGNRGDFVTITMEALDENGAPYLRLLDENGRVIRTSETGVGREAVLGTVRLPSEGNYFVNSGWLGEPGGYRISLRSVEPARLALGETAAGVSAEPQLWAFDGRRGDIVTIAMEARDDQGVPLLRLSDESGNVIAAAERGDSHIAFICGIRLPDDDQYLVETGWIASPGEYTLSLARTEPETIESGGTVEGVGPGQCAWQFEGGQGDFVTIAMDALNTSGDPFLALLNEEEGEIAFDDGGVGLNAHLAAILPADGPYLINAGWIGDPGPYSLSLTQVRPETLTIGDTVEGTGPEQSVWQFEGSGGDFLTIAMDALDPAGNPLLTLYDEAGEVVDVNDDGGTGLNAQQHVILPEDGSYIIHAGWLSQPVSYTLSLERLEAGLLSLPATVREASPGRWAWRFVGDQGNYVTIAMDALEEGGDPWLRLYNENGRLVGENDDGFRLNALLQLPLPQSGVYFIDAGWFNNPGRYRLTLRQADPEIDLESVAADSRQDALQLIEDGHVEEGLALFEEVELIEASLSKALLSARDYNQVCWFGSLWGSAAEVMFACEVAVKREPEHGGFADSRGVARALTGNFEGAIDDFRAFLEWGFGRNNDWRQEWIGELEAGRNPFEDEALLEQLLNE